MCGVVQLRRETDKRMPVKMESVGDLLTIGQGHSRSVKEERREGWRGNQEKEWSLKKIANTGLCQGCFVCMTDT